MLENFLPKVSIVIPVYNGANYMREAIGSALSQTYPNIEVLVINDGSTDNGETEHIALSYGDRIRYYSKENGGVATALNLGIEKMTGEYFSWLSHDDIYYPDKIRTQIDHLKLLTDKRTILYGGYHIINKTSNIIGEFKYGNKGDISYSNMGIYPLLNGYINGCTLLIHKDCFLKVGLFDIKLKTTQDYALWFKIFKQYPLLYHKEILIKSRVHAEQGSLKESIHGKEANELWVSFIEETTEQDIKESYKSLPVFYYSMVKRLKTSYVPKAYYCALEKLLKIEYEKKVSVILPAYNRGYCICFAIESVLNQNYSNFELIVIDDGSTDDTSDVIQKYNDKIIYIYQQNQGAAAARNAGMRKAKGEYIAFIDSDDLWTREHLEKHINVLDANIEYAMSYNLARIIDHRNIETGLSAINVFLDEDIYPEMLFINNNIITTPSVVLRKLVLDEIGNFDESMDMCEDIDLWRRIAKRHKVKRIPEFLTIVNTRENQFCPNSFFAKRKIYLEKAISEDLNMSSDTIRDLYIELYIVYSSVGCSIDLIYEDLLCTTKKCDKLEQWLKERLIKVLTLNEQFDTINKGTVERDVQISAILSSRSWWITAPLRAIGAKLRLMRDRIATVKTIAGFARTNGLKVGWRVLKGWSLLRSSEAFDITYYLRQNPDVTTAQIDPTLHYLMHGAREGRNPNPTFDTNWYLKQNPDVMEAGVNPLIHYLQFGASEGRAPNSLFRGHF